MGLALEVGMLPDLLECDPEGAEALQDSFAAVNELLDEAGLEPHEEPVACKSWGAEMFGYSGLHYLRRVAAHLDGMGKLPPPGDDDAASDSVLEAYFASYLGEGPGFLSRLFKKPPRFSHGFDHLILHSDAEGFYLPVDFDEVLFGDDEIVPGGMVGSAPRLLAELDRLAAALEIPPDLDSESDALWEAADSQGEGDALWQRYGIESYTCVALREGCRHSVETGAALVFT